MSETPKRGRAARARNVQVPEGATIATFNKYEEAVDTVDALIRHDFPAPAVAIVGNDLRSVERVRARVSYSRVAIRGLITGSWVGLIYWLIFGGTGTADTTTTASAQLATTTLMPSVIIGAGVGMLVGVIRFSMQRRSHEFLSFSTIVAASYQVVVPAAMSDQANRALAEHSVQCVNKK